MKNKIIYKYLGKVLIVYSLMMIVPIVIALYYKNSIIEFIIPLIISLIMGLLLNRIKTDNNNIYAKDGFIIVSLSWIIISIIGALPFFISKNTTYVNSLFETISAITTTGSTIFDNVEALPKSLLFYRSYLQLIGGMGVITFVMAIIPLSRNDKSLHLLNAEMPGNSVGKLVPSTKKTVIYLYLIYFILLASEILFLVVDNNGLFKSTLISMSTVSTGGFSYLNSSLSTLSLKSKFIVALYMFLSGINFNIYFLIVMRKFKNIVKSEELKAYILIFVLSSLFVFIKTYNIYKDISVSLSGSIFHTASIMTSTGFSIGNINLYPSSCKIIFLILMLISACAGSTCGGFKISRLLLSLKTIRRDILKVIHPNSVHIIKLEGKRVDDDLINSNSTFLSLYVILIVIIMFIVSFDGFSLDTNINAVFSTFANTGLCFDISNFSMFSSLSKIVLSLGMLLGRLEIFPIVVLFSDLKK